MIRCCAANSMPNNWWNAVSPSGRAAVELDMPKKLGRGMSDDAVRAAGDLVPVEQHDADDLAEAQRDDGEIVAAQPQHRESPA